MTRNVVRRLIGGLVSVGLAGAAQAVLPATASATFAATAPPPAGQTTLAQAPAGLRAAVEQALDPSAPQTVTELTASDGAAGDQFSFSVAVSGTTAIVGARGHNTNTGSAYIFVTNGTTWTQQAELTASDGAKGDGFGFAVAISGTTAVVGAPFKGGQVGVAYVFVSTGTTWTQQAKLQASDAASKNFFGGAVATTGTNVFVGAAGWHSQTGSAYVFASSGTTWSQQAQLTASDGAKGDQFGYSIGAAGASAVVGAWGRATFTGAAYVFTGSGATWTQQAELTALDGVTNAQFGYAVAIAGTTLVVGAPGRNSLTGAAYVFAGSGSTWTQQAELAAPGGAVGDAFGLSVAIAGTTVVVGAPYKSNFTGAAYVYISSAGVWSELTELIASDGVSGDQLGYSVALVGTTALVGAFGKNSATGALYPFVVPTKQSFVKFTASDGAAGDNFGYSVSVSGTLAAVGAPARAGAKGAVYLFVNSLKKWTQQAELTAADGVAGDRFGAAVAVSGGAVIVGAPAKNGSAGAVYVFGKRRKVWAQVTKLAASDGVAGDTFGAAVSVSASVAVVGAPAKSSSTGEAYVFVATKGKWSQKAKLNATGAAAGDQFGTAVAVAGTTAVVGATGHNSSQGAAYVFGGTTWSQQAALTAADGLAGDLFGSSVAVAGTLAAIGAPAGGGTNGAAYVFTGSGTSWSQQAELLASDGVAGDRFGAAVGVSTSRALVGAPAKNASTGAAYIYSVSGTTWTQQGKRTASDGVSGDQFGASVSLSGTTALVGDPFKHSGTGAAYLYPSV